ncbi:MAG TPA: hypothetical protein VN950_22555 [Terriglobales bacterium]|nr:hypothetical protein [Terriglobales bacterium]
MSLYPNSIPRCERVKINGTQCGSPALKRNHFCYFHKRWQETRIVLNANRARRGRAALDLPVLEDANSIQVSLMQIMRLILSGQMDTKTAGLLLYALQTASSNLSRINFEPTVKTRVVIDPKTVDQTPLGEDPWRREDFEEEYEEDDQEEAAEPIEAKPQDFGVDTEWTAEVIPDLEGRAEAGGESEQIIPQIQAVATAASPRHRRRAVKSHPHIGCPARDSLAGRERIRVGQSHCGGTTSIVPVSLLPPTPLFSESTYDERSSAAKGEPAARYPKRTDPRPCRSNKLRVL